MAGEKEPPKVRSFACASCGAPLTVRGFGQTETVACGSCGAVVDVTDENFKILSTAEAKVKIEPLIPLGNRGTLLGELLEVIGYMRRKVVVEGVSYEWGEYLLFNPYKGFRWLNEYNGHWTFIRTLMERPAIVGGAPRYLDRQFQHFQTSTAEVTYVIGEFPWRAAIGEKAVVQDYVAPPYLMSCESSEKEIVWSLGQYLEPAVVWKAFQPKTPPSIRVGVAPCEPNPHKAASSPVLRMFVWFCFAALAVQLLTAFSARNEVVYKNVFQFQPRAAEKSFVSDVFEIRGRTSNVEVLSHADVSNDWIYLNLALVDEESGHAYDFGREISYYSGSDSDGSWSEGSRDDSAVITSVPSGRYYLRVEPEGGNPTAYTIEVRRDVPQWWIFLITLVALAAAPIWVGWRSFQFERQRWAESDHPMINVSSSDDD